MKNDNIKTESFKDLFAKGMELTFEKLLKQKKATNGTFVFYENGKVEKVKASDIRL